MTVIRCECGRRIASIVINFCDEPVPNDPVPAVLVFARDVFDAGVFGGDTR